MVEESAKGTPMLTFSETVKMSPEQLDAVRVSCSTCPVSLHCLAGGYGTGWTYDCCRVTTLRVETEDGQKLVVIDCGRHNFTQRATAKDHPCCPLCSGEFIIDGPDADNTATLGSMRYLPTVYAVIDSATRLRQMRSP